MSNGTLAGRLRWLIDTAYGGSVNAAAHDIGMHQATLARFVDGRVTNPKTDSLRPIAARFSVGLGWLLAGEGEPPDLSAREWLPAKMTKAEMAREITALRAHVAELEERLRE